MKVYFLDIGLKKFIKSLEKPTIAKVFRIIDLLKEFGPNIGMPHSKKINNKLFELRIRGVQEVRIFYTFYNDAIILLHAFVKKTWKIPKKELHKAERRLKKLD